MGNFKVGDIVARKSYGGDIYFKIVDIKNNGKENIITLKGIAYRIEADAPETDLILIPGQRVNEYTMRINAMVYRKSSNNSKSIIGRRPKKAFSRYTSNEKSRVFSRTGKVLHIDGDSDYLKTCLDQYHKFGIDAAGEHVPEKEQPSAVYDLLQKHRPDILVLTGHDGFIKERKDYSNINNYWNSKYFVDAVREARRYERDMDGLVVFAGACQSMFSEIVKAGANYASSPDRVLIHALDPVLVCQKVAFGGIGKILNPSEVISNTITGAEGIGGLQTRGKYRSGYPQKLKNTWNFLKNT